MAPPLRGTHDTFADALFAAARQFPEREAYVDGDQRVTFAEWARRADAVASEMVARGVRPGDVVAVTLPPSADFAVATAAGSIAGAVVTGLNPRLGPREVEAICARANPALAVVSAAGGPAGMPASTPILARDELARAGERPGLAADRPRRMRADPAVVIWTSGTTGLPKGAWFDHDNLEAAVRTAGVMTAPFDRRLVPVPFAHAGYLAKLWEQVAWGTALVITPVPWRASDMLRLVVDERITVAGAVPTQWAKLIEEPGLDDADLSSLRLGVVATAPASPELVERVAARCGCPLVVRYAMTESPSITGTDPDDAPEVQHRTVGRPQAGVELSLRGEDGAEVAPGQVGRIHVRGPCVMRGYWQEPALTTEVLDGDGWLRSGDLGHLDAAGNLVLDGRVGDMYIRGGYNVYPVEVEHVLVEHPAVAEASVVGVPTPVIGEVGVAFVVPVAGVDTPSLEALRAWCRDRLADYKAPDRLEFLDALPLTAMLKVDKAALRARL